ncbi:MAG: type II toxin-antitoxin system VapC family toxin [Sporomusaceae bacterium]|jgi:predicted nucleic acid-binding protein|nr:type II toxin-antitoxin system VapC family toxin [Sporomusaceae bacterium]
MTIFALDTNIISYILKERVHVISCVRKALIEGNKLIIPPLVYYEVRRGLLSKDTPIQTASFNKFCQQIPIGKMEHKMLDKAAQIYASLRLQSRPIDDADILIAAFCIENAYTLVTNNTKHFEGIDGLKLVNWAESK